MSLIPAVLPDDEPTTVLTVSFTFFSWTRLTGFLVSFFAGLFLPAVPDLEDVEVYK